MKIREDVLAVILLDVINCFILAAPSQPAVCHRNPGADGCYTAAAIRRNRPLCRALPEKIPEADSRPEKKRRSASGLACVHWYGLLVSP